MKAIVLSGGGAKGAYQAGVWKAIRKCRIKYNIVTGTSIGALNGMMMVQNDFYKCLKMWKTIDYSHLYDANIKNETMYVDYFKEALNGGIKTNKIQKLISDNYKANVFYKSNIDYGLVTFNLTKLKHEYITKQNTDQTKMPLYIMASASCFPAFEKKIIDSASYIDGGFYDNLPINLAVELGATSIIAVDLNAIGVKQKTVADVEIINIKPRNKIHSFLMFNKDECRKAIKYGYNDAMKTFNKLDGNRFTFEKGSLDKNNKRYKDKIIEYINYLLKNKQGDLYQKVASILAIKRITSEKTIANMLNEVIEYLGVVYELEQFPIYNINKYNKLLIKKLDSSSVIKIDEKKLKNIKGLLNHQTVIKYTYSLINDKKNIKKILSIASVFPKDFIGAIYLKIVKEVFYEKKCINWT